MTPTLVPKLRATPSISRQREDDSPRPNTLDPNLTAVVIDESAVTDVELLLSAIGSGPGPAKIVLTRHPIPPCVLGIGAGTEAMVMWNEDRTEWRSLVDTTADRLRTLRSELRSRGRGPVETIDSFPTWRPLRSIHRREIDGLVRTLVRLQPDRIVIDPSHHLLAELHALIEKHDRLGPRLAQPAVEGPAGREAPSPAPSPQNRLRTPTFRKPPARQEDFSALWIDLGGSE